MEEAWRRRFGWSFSKSGSWNQCRKRFYYNVIKKFERDPEGSRARQLASLSTIDMVRGSVVHSVISEQILQARMGRPVRLDIAIRQAARLLSDSMGKNHEKLVEHWNGIPVSKGDMIDVANDIDASLTNFCREVWPQRGECKCLEQEGAVKNMAIGEWKVLVKPDLISESKSVVTVTDWKTGERERDADDLLQMSIYSIYAMDKYGKGLDEVLSEVVYLSLPKTKSVPVDGSSVEAAKARVIAESKEMLGCSGVDDFYPSASIRNCKYCNFATLCTEGGDILGRFAPAASSKVPIGPSVGTSDIKRPEAVLPSPGDLDPSSEPPAEDAALKGDR